MNRLPERILLCCYLTVLDITESTKLTEQGIVTTYIHTRNCLESPAKVLKTYKTNVLFLLTFTEDIIDISDMQQVERNCEV